MKIDQKYIVIGLVVIVIFVLCYMNKSTKQDLKHKDKVYEKMENSPRVVNYNTEGCGWSRKLQPTWEKVMEHYQSKPVQVIDHKCDASESNQQQCSAENLPGVPFIIAYVGNEKHGHVTIKR